MERVLEELKRIEEEADKIRLEASEKAEEIIRMARQRAEKLIGDAEKEAERASLKMLKRFRQEMVERHNKVLETNRSRIDKVRRLANKNMNSVIDLVFRTVVGEREE